MGAQPATALAMAVIPFGTDRKIEETLFHLMAGALKVLKDAGCALVGGHTCEGDELALGEIQTLDWSLPMDATMSNVHQNKNHVL